MSASQYVGTEAKTVPELQSVANDTTFRRLILARSFPIGMWFLANPWPSDDWPFQAFWTLFTTYSLFCWTSCFHETVHQTLWPDRRSWNVWMGRILGMVMFTPYTVYRESHIRHHAYLNTPDDWELWPYSDPRTSKMFRLCFVWADLLLGFVTAPFIYGRIAFHKSSPLKSPETRAAIRNEYLLSVVFWGAILSGAAWFEAWHEFIQVWLIPHVLAGIVQTGRKFTEHLGMSSSDPLLGTRTVIGQGFWTRACAYANFDIFTHGAHHRHPRLPHGQLIASMQQHMDQNPGIVFPVFSTYAGAVWNMLPAMFLRPGVGVNAGGVVANHDSLLPHNGRGEAVGQAGAQRLAVAQVGGAPDGK